MEQSMAEQIAEAVASAVSQMLPTQSIPGISFSLFWGALQFNIEGTPGPTIVVGDVGEEDE